MDNSKQYIISFCSGYSGIELGLEFAGLEHRVVAYVEIEAFAIANLVAKMEQGHLVPAPVWTNLKTFPCEEFRGRVDGITAGYPCQPFSHAGQRKGTDDPRHLWPHIRQAIRVIQPRWCFFENVEGHISLGLSTVLADLEEDGYRTTWGIFSAEEVGAPHRRKRVFILADSSSQRANGKTGSSGKKIGGQGSALSRELIQPSKVANTQRAKQHRWGTDSRNRWTEFGCYCWPSRPGEEQQEWEAPRIDEIESSMGSAVDGINTRVDQLRLLGNGVVPQTAAKAWTTLTRG